MKIYLWPDRLPRPGPRAVIRRGECQTGECGQFSISISNGETGMTVRFADEAEFQQFLERGEITIPREVA
jgi:hypothetical protein